MKKNPENHGIYVKNKKIPGFICCSYCNRKYCASLKEYLFVIGDMVANYLSFFKFLAKRIQLETLLIFEMSDNAVNS